MQGLGPMGGLIDLNTTEEDETLSSGSSASGLSSSSASSSVCLELWHACAGPLISLPKKGSLVVYFPQGHLEQVRDFPAAAYDVPPHVFCRVVDVKLHAEDGSDDVYCQVSLVPENEQFEQKLRLGEIDANGEEEDLEAFTKSTTSHMFCKTLTASDTSTHGGFSVPRRAAEDCFPPLDYNQQRPSQELIAKDLHGLEWKFRHIYRGQPRRHLLTTGWSAFVNKKKLVSGDAVLFLRGEDGELRLGIRRAAQFKGGVTFSASCGLMNPSTIMDVLNALSMRSSFNIYYNPRANLSEFIVPLHKFLKSLDNSFMAGMRFRMRFETEDAAERRCTGLITGVGDVDPVRWPGSKWRCLMVRWDDMEVTRNNRVSPWEIEPSGTSSGSGGVLFPGMKRTRVGMPSAKPEYSMPNGTGASDLGESLRFQKVLQGQEIMGMNTPYDGIPTHNQRCYPVSGVAPTGNTVRVPQVKSGVSCNGIGFSESFRFRKVLQGQEIFPSMPYGRALPISGAYENRCIGALDGRQVQSSWNGWPARIQDSAVSCLSALSRQALSPSSVLLPQAFSPASNSDAKHVDIDQGVERKARNGKFSHVSEFSGGTLKSSRAGEPCLNGEAQEGSYSFGMIKPHGQVGNPCSLVSQSAFAGKEELLSSCKSSCRLFGFSLTEEKHVTIKDGPSPMNYSLNPSASLMPHGEKFHQEPSLRGQAVGSNCTKVSNFYAMRDMLSDIAL